MAASFSQNPAAPHVERLVYEVVVIGGGLAGLCAAVAAARQGVRTALLHDRPMLGGNCSSEVRVIPHGANFANAWAQETGLPHAIILEDRRGNHQQFLQHGMTNSGFDLTLMEFARREPNLTVYYNTAVRAVESQPSGEEKQPELTLNKLGRVGGGARRIVSISAFQLGSEKEFRFEAGQFIDATGDGTVGFFAGADFRYGREARSEFDEPLAPEVSDDASLGSTITLAARDTGVPVPYTAPEWAVDYRSEEEIGFLRKIGKFDGPLFGGFWWMEVCNPFHQIRDNQQVRDELHRHLLGVWSYIKNHSPLREAARNYALEWIGMIPGKRESRRLLGDVIVTEKDCHEDARWPDAIAFAGWWIDLHIPGGILNKSDPSEREVADANYKHWIRVPVHTLPLRAFYSRNIENLWMAGRCFSASHVALGPARVMQTLGMMGQAVGTAAAFAQERGVLPREVADPVGKWLKPLQQLLLRQDVRIPGLRNHDPGDLALQAEATASSEAALTGTAEPEGKWWRIGGCPCPAEQVYEAMAAVLPVTEGRLEEARCYLRNRSPDPVRVVCRVGTLERIWDRPDVAPCAEVAAVLPGGFEGWVEFPLEAETAPGLPHRFSLEPEPGRVVEWASAAHSAVGAAAQYRHTCEGGPEIQNARLNGFRSSETSIPAYCHWGQLPHAMLAIKLTPEPRPYSARQVNNGIAWPEAMPNLWISDPALPLPQHLELRWKEPRSFNRVEVSFDTHLGRLTQHAPAFFAPPECARDWRLEVWEKGEWETVYRETGNFQRKRVARFPSRQSQTLRLVVEATHGAPEARVYEIRVYSEEEEVF